MDYQPIDDKAVNVQSATENAAAHILSQSADLAVPQSAHDLKTNPAGVDTAVDSKAATLHHVELTGAILGLNSGPVPPLGLRAHHRHTHHEQPVQAELTGIAFGGNFSPFNGHPPESVRRVREQPIKAELTGIAFGGNFSPFNGHPPESVRRVHEQQRLADQPARGSIV